MKKLLLLLFLANTILLSAQEKYPYELIEGDKALNAYWYAVPSDSIHIKYANMKLPFRTIVHVYGKVPKGDFTVSIKALSNGDVFFSKAIEVVGGKINDSNAGYFISNGNFRLEYLTGTELKKPDTIELELTDTDGKLNKSIPCIYHTISGRITDFDGSPIEGFFAAGPDDFVRNTIVWSDNNGNYSIELPERSYNAFMSDDETYGQSSLEYWGYRMIVDRDETLNIRIGNGEMYNLHAWASNGGSDTYFIYFRPMVLPLAKLPDEKNTAEMTFEEKVFFHKNISPDLQSKDITVKLNGEVLPIISVQPIYETVKDYSDNHLALNAYIVQVERPVSAKAKKLTFEVSFDTYVTIDEKPVRVNSMGTYQLYSSFDGYSESTF